MVGDVKNPESFKGESEKCLEAERTDCTCSLASKMSIRGQIEEKRGRGSGDKQEAGLRLSGVKGQ